MGDEYLTVADVAARLKLTPKTVRNRMHDGTWRRGRTLVFPARYRPPVPLVGDSSAGSKLRTLHRLPGSRMAPTSHHPGPVGLAALTARRPSNL